MAINPEDLTINFSFRNMLAVPKETREQLANSGVLDQFMNQMSPTQMALLFPDYYKQGLPDVVFGGPGTSGFVSQRLGLQGAEQPTYEPDVERRPQGGQPGRQPGRDGGGVKDRTKPATARPPTLEERQVKLLRDRGLLATPSINLSGELPQDRKGLIKAAMQAAKSVGLSDKQAAGFIAEINRENSFNPNVLFGSHSEPGTKHTGRKNAGMLSWAGPRRTAFEKHMREAGLMDENGSIPRTYEALVEQFKFSVQKEMPQYKSGREFLANRDISKEDSYNLLGKGYVVWDVSGKNHPDRRSYQNSLNRREQGYNEALQAIGELEDIQPSAQEGQPETVELNTARAEAIRQAVPNADNIIPKLDPSAVNNMSEEEFTALTKKLSEMKAIPTGVQVNNAVETASRVDIKEDMTGSRRLSVSDELDRRVSDTVSSVLGPGWNVTLKSGGIEGRKKGTSRRHTAYGPDGQKISIAGDYLITNSETGKRPTPEQYAQMGQYWMAKEYGSMGVPGASPQGAGKWAHFDMVGANQEGLREAGFSDNQLSWMTLKGTESRYWYYGGAAKGQSELLAAGLEGKLPDNLYAPEPVEVAEEPASLSEKMGGHPLQPKKVKPTQPEPQASASAQAQPEPQAPPPAQAQSEAQAAAPETTTVQLSEAARGYNEQIMKNLPEGSKYNAETGQITMPGKVTMDDVMKKKPLYIPESLIKDNVTFLAQGDASVELNEPHMITPLDGTGQKYVAGEAGKESLAVTPEGKSTGLRNAGDYMPKNSPDMSSLKLEQSGQMQQSVVSNTMGNAESYKPEMIKPIDWDSILSLNSSPSVKLAMASSKFGNLGFNRMSKNNPDSYSTFAKP